MQHPLTRRAMLTGTAASAAALAATTIPGQASAHPHVMAATKPAITLKKGAVVLMQGDSITDAGRDKRNADKYNDFKVLGNGYATTFLLAFVLTTLGLAMLLGVKEPEPPQSPESDQRARQATPSPTKRLRLS